MGELGTAERPNQVPGFERTDVDLEAALVSALHSVFGPQVRPSVLAALERFLSKPTQSFPVRSVNVPALSGQPTLLLERDTSRVQTIILNNGATSLVVGNRNVNNNAGDQDAGWIIAANGSLTLDHYAGELWGFAASGGPLDVRLLDFCGYGF